MKTPNSVFRIRPALSKLMDDEVAVKKSRNRTEVVEKALCQRYELEYQRITTKSKSE